MPNTKAPCWPDDKDYLDGRKELRVPSSKLLKAHWDADIIDVEGVKPGTIIAVTDDFVVRFRVELVGELWLCLGGCWCFDLGFTAIGDGEDFNLSRKLPPNVLEIRDWRGCETRCIELCYRVPAETIPADYCGTLYEVGARFSLHCCCNGEHKHERPILVGYEALEEREFY
jgi:hypothetical protein